MRSIKAAMGLKKHIAIVVCLFLLLLVAGCVSQPAFRVEVLPPSIPCLISERDGQGPMGLTRYRFRMI